MEKLTFNKPINKPKPAPHERADMVNQVLEFMGEDNFGKWLGLTKHLSPSGISALLRQAREGNNPPALFYYLLKESKK